jgi:hypothetical protein
MFKNVLPAITALFANALPCREPVNFSWRLVRRKNRPFLLVPEKSGSVSDSFELYSPHRRLAKLWRWLAPRMLRTPVAGFFGRVAIRADGGSELMQFLAEQSNLPAVQLQTPAIKFGGIPGNTSRLVMLLCDAGDHPFRVIKLGLNAEGRAKIEREADLLSRLPVNVIGCAGITGRFSSGTLSAFATAYSSGAGLENDIGIEKLFHNWLNDTLPEPIKNLASWQELESVAKGSNLPSWREMRGALAAHTVRTTIFHGDFAPWNVRIANLENIRGFDWERGHLKGIPAWDWFHFIVQTSILVKRHSPERVAAELQQLIRSPRFQNYASAAGISQIIEPLLLAYLLHQKLVVQPLEGGELTDRLFGLLWAQWQLKLNGGTPAFLPPAGQRRPPGAQVKLAFTRLANLFWEPSLSPVSQPPFNDQLRRYWLGLLAAFIWICGFATLHSFTGAHLLFTPFYLVPCVLLALKTDRRLAFIAAYVAAFAGPLLYHFKYPQLVPLDVTCWNVFMRVLVFLLIVILLDGVRKQSLFRDQQHTLPEQNPIQAIRGNWAVIVIASIFFALVMVLDGLTSPHLIFLALYMLPCVILTLALDWRWGTIVAVLASVVGPLLQRLGDPGYQHMGIEFWNTVMRFVIFQIIVLLLERIRHGNSLLMAGHASSVFSERAL